MPFPIDAVVSPSLSTFAFTVALKSALLLVATAASMPLLRRRSAAVRHMVWALGLGAALLLPAVALVTPSVPLLPAAAPVDPAPLSREHVIATETERIESQRTAAEVIAPSSQSSAPARLTGASLLLALWFVGAVLLLGRFGAGLVSVRGIVRRASPVEDPRWAAVADRTRHLTTMRFDLRVSEEIDMPFATGLLRKAIVLPASSVEWTVERRTAVLLHEIAHLDRRDLIMNVIAHVARAVYWFNPLAWYAAHRLRVEGECAADDRVLSCGARPSEYADHLLHIATTARTSLPVAALAMARRSAFEGRLLAILSPDARRTPPSRLRFALSAVAVAAILVPLAAVSPTARVNAMTQGGAPARSSGEERQERSSAVPALVDALADASAAVRLAAVQSLGSLEDPRAIAALGKALKEDTDPRVRQAAAEALGEIDDARAVPHLVAALPGERVAGVREQIVRALGEIGDPAGVAAISSAARDENVEVRRAVAHALSEIEEQSTLPTLLTMARDPDVEVRRHVADALGDLESRAAFDALVALARDSDAEVRANAVSSLGDLEDSRALDALVSALKDANAEVRANAADAIDDIPGLERAPRALIEALADPSPDVRHNAAHALGSIGDEAAVPALRRGLSDGHADFRRAAAEALADIGGAEAITALMGLLKDPDPEIRRIAAEALGKRR